MKNRGFLNHQAFSLILLMAMLCLPAVSVYGDIALSGQITNEDNTIQWDWITNTPTGSDWIGVGNTGSGTLGLDDSIDGNGITSVRCTSLVAGHQPGSSGALTLSGAGASLGHVYLFVGNSGSGTFVMQDGAAIATPTYANNRVYVGWGENGYGKMTMKENSTFVLYDYLYVGGHAGSHGELWITDGSVFNTSIVYVGRYAGSFGKVVVDGSDSELKTTTNIGYLGTGELYVRNGGYVLANNGLVIGYANGSHGTAEITGAGSLLSTTHGVTVGRGDGSTGQPGTGILKLSKGGKVETSGLNVGYSGYNEHGTLDFIIGNTGAGTVNCGFIETSDVYLHIAYLQMHVDPGANLTVGSQYTLVDYEGMSAVYNRFIGIDEGDIYTSPEGYHFRINYATDLGGGDLAITATVVELPPCVVDSVDIFLLMSGWLDSGCGEPDWCRGADLNHSTIVNLHDFSQIAVFWMNDCPALWPWQ